LSFRKDAPLLPRAIRSPAGAGLSEIPKPNAIHKVLSDNSGLSKGRDFSVLSTETIRVSDLRAKHYLVLAGVGWGNLPEPLIRDDLLAGRLQVVPLAEWRERPYPFYAIHMAGSPPRPAASRFIARLIERLK
jgi:DNA-binding transcriptional LysR family regulator